VPYEKARPLPCAHPDCWKRGPFLYVAVPPEPPPLTYRADVPDDWRAPPQFPRSRTAVYTLVRGGPDSWLWAFVRYE
jgi:hypothetical protein